MVWGMAVAGTKESQIMHQAGRSGIIDGRRVECLSLDLESGRIGSCRTWSSVRQIISTSQITYLLTFMLPTLVVDPVTRAHAFSYG